MRDASGASGSRGIYAPGRKDLIMIKLIQTLISGLSLGSIYALIALGYTMVYGIAKMLNFAHGDIIMIGALRAFSSKNPIFVCSNDAYICVEKQKTYCGQRLPSI